MKKFSEYNRRITLATLAFASLMMVGCSSMKEIVQKESYRQDMLSPKKKVAVIDYVGGQSLTFSDQFGSHHFKLTENFGQVGDYEVKQLFFNALNMALAKRDFQILERDKLYDLLREQQLAKADFSNLSDRDKAMKIGRLLGVDYLVDGEVFNFNVHYSYTLGFWDVIGNALTFNFGSGEPTEVLERQANQLGYLNDLDVYSVQLSSFTGLSLRVIEVKTGQISYVGTAIDAFYVPKITASNLKDFNKFGILVKSCGILVDEAIGREERRRDG